MCTIISVVFMLTLIGHNTVFIHVMDSKEKSNKKLYWIGFSLNSIWQSCTFKVDRFIIPFGVSLVWTKLSLITTLVQHLVHSCQNRIEKQVTFWTNVKHSTIELNTSLIEYSKTPPTENSLNCTKYVKLNHCGRGERLKIDFLQLWTPVNWATPPLLPLHCN